MSSSATNHVTGLENGSAGYWWRHTYPVEEGTQTDEDSSSGPWNNSYDTTVTYPGFYEGASYSLGYGGGREEYFAYLGDAFWQGDYPATDSGMFPFAFSDEELLLGQGQTGVQYGMVVAAEDKSIGDVHVAPVDGSRGPSGGRPGLGSARAEQPAVTEDTSADRPAGSLRADDSGGAVAMAGGEGGGSQQEEANWWSSSGWWWLNPWSYPIIRVPINYYTGYYDALDRAKELQVARQARDPNRIMRAGDIRSLTQGVSQWEAAARAESQIKQFGRDRIADAVYIAGGEIVGMAASGGFADDAARYADEVANAAGRTLDEILANEELFRRWLKHKKPVTRPLSPEMAEKVWKKAVELGFRPCFDLGHPGKTWEMPHINIGGSHIPVAPNFQPPGT